MFVKAEDFIDIIRINGIQMYKVEDRLFLSKKDAYDYAVALDSGNYMRQDEIIEKRESTDYKTLVYGSADDSYSIEKAFEKGTLKGILL